ncbi:hypothetical protein CK203_093984 [Vitis vinifera]|uniref:Uncharacterized protein n=1 Tax=Vitis vinifera TaxID=29760 RepID=A0A438CKB6_VITVI|nr:hypothetical protein CK203_093984 [Vitis vinifera]
MLVTRDEIKTPARHESAETPIGNELIIATQTQHTAILRQIQHHLGILSAPEHPMPVLSEHIEPSQAPHFVEQALPSEEPTTGDAETST